MTILDGVEGISTITLTVEDVVRHRLVKDIIKAYDKIEGEERARKERRRAEQNGDDLIETRPDWVPPSRSEGLG